MIGSKCLCITRLTNCVAKNFLLQNRRISLNKQIVRRSHGGQYYYRKAPPPLTKKELLPYECLGAVIWWWILWNCFTNYHELIGIHFPDPSKWTDEELGIPPLEEVDVHLEED